MLKGYPEFTTPSVPPKAYRHKTLSGAVTFCSFSSTDQTCPSGDGGIAPGSVYHTLDGGPLGGGVHEVTLQLVSATFLRANLAEGQVWTLSYHYDIVNGGGCRAVGGALTISGSPGWVAYSDGSSSGDFVVDVSFPLGGTTFDLEAYPLGPSAGHATTTITVLPKTLQSGTRKAYSGLCSINDGGIETVGGQVALQDLGDTCSGGSGGTVSTIDTVISSEAHIGTAVVTRTTRSQTAIPGCVTGDDGHDLSVDGTRTETLSSEDTEAAAITRMLATIPRGAFEALPNCCAGWQARTSGFLFNYTEAEFQVNVDGSPGQNVRVIVSFSRRVYGVGPYLPYLDLSILIQIGSNGKGTYEGVVENARGYQTCYTSCRVQ